MSQNVPGSPVIKMCSKHNETLLRTLHAEVRILTVYAKYVAMPTKSDPDGGQNVGKKAAAGVSMKKNDSKKMSVSIDR